MNDIRVKVAGWVDVAENHRKGFRRCELLRSDVGRAEAVAAGSRRTQVDCVRDLEVVAQAFVDHQLRSFEKHGHHVWKQKHSPLEVGIDRIGDCVKNPERMN